jgi:predicted amidohydrolase
MVTLGLAQIRPHIASVRENLELIENTLEQAAGRGIDVLVLPELVNSGYAFKSKEEVAASAETVGQGAASALFKDWSRVGRLIVAGICERIEDRFYNSAVAFAKGEHITTYRKIHLFGDEARWFAAGESEPPVIEFGGNRYGIMVCFDWAFPEVARILALNGAQVILHPANLVLPYCQTAMVTRSIENRIFTATANRIGNERELEFSGMSQVTNPRGEILARASETDAELLVVEIDPRIADDKNITQANDVLKDRRPELYHRLTDST